MSNRTLTAALLVVVLIASLLLPTTLTSQGSDPGPHRPPPDEVTLEAAADAGTNASLPTTNYGDAPTLGVGRAGVKFTNTARTYIGFDLTHLPSEIEIVSAHLELYLTSWVVGTGPFEIAANTAGGSWNESDITWNTQPAVDHQLDKAMVPEATGYQSWDVTDAVEGWSTRRLRNYGLVLSSGLESFGATFNSKESRSVYRPRLVISYYGSILTATPTATRTIPVKPPTVTPTGTRTIPVKPPTATRTATPYRTYLPLVLKQIPPG